MTNYKPCNIVYSIPLVSSTNQINNSVNNYTHYNTACRFLFLSQHPTPCSCCDSEFLYAPCGHIVTGDLSIVRNQKLKDVLRKGIYCV